MENANTLVVPTLITRNSNVNMCKVHIKKTIKMSVASFWCPVF